MPPKTRGKPVSQTPSRLARQCQNDFLINGQYIPRTRGVENQRRIDRYCAANHERDSRKDSTAALAPDQERYRYSTYGVATRPTILADRTWSIVSR